MTERKDRAKKTAGKRPAGLKAKGGGRAEKIPVQGGAKKPLRAGKGKAAARGTGKAGKKVAGGVKRRGAVDGAGVWRNRIVGHGEVSPLEIVAHPKNYKAHPEQQRDALKGVIGQVGFVRSVTVNRRTGVLVDGHLRVALAIETQQPAIAVEYVDLSSAEEDAVLAALDPLGHLAEIDYGLLGELVGGLEDGALADILRELPGMADEKIGNTPDGNEDPEHEKGDAKATIGAYRFTIPRAKYEKWVETMRQEVGFDEDSIIAEIRRRLRLKA